MRKPVKHPSKDENTSAFNLVRRVTGTEEPAEVTSAEVSRVMASLGRRGGKIGGKRRLETMTPEQRSEIALKAARARWAKKKR